jgi:hypothetical protein
MKTRLIYFTIAFSMTISGLYAQETKPTRIHQVGINFSSLNSFGIHYKTGSDKTLFRVSLVSVNMVMNHSWGREEDSIDQKSNNIGAGFMLGFEKRIPVINNLDFLWGLEVGCNYYFHKNDYNSSYPDPEQSEWYVTPGVYLVLGASYTVKEHFVFGAEITPGIWSRFGKQTIKSNGETVYERTSNDFGFGFNNNSASLSIAYRFGK